MHERYAARSPPSDSSSRGPHLGFPATVATNALR